MKRLILAAGLTASILSGCGGGSAGPAADAPLVWARSSDSTTLDPGAVEWGEDAKVTQNLYETLVSFKTDSPDLEGRLATSWTFSPDGRTLTFELRQGVKFHDGTDFDAGDVVFTMNRLIDPKHPHKPAVTPYASNFSSIAAVRADGTHRVVFELRDPSPIILYHLALFGAGVVSPDAVQKHGEHFAKNPVGTGPYRLSNWERDVKIVLERFDGYWGVKPRIARVIVVPVQSPQTAIQKLNLGEVHVVDHMTPADIAPLQQSEGTAVDFERSMNVCYLGFNMKKAPYNDLRFRKAVSLALDRSTLNELAYYGLAEVADNIVPPVIWRHSGELRAYEHDLDEAKRLLAELKLESGQVELIHMTFARPYVPEPQRVAEWVKDQLRRVGLEVKLTGYDKSAYTQMTKAEDHPMYLLGWNADYPDPDNFFYPLLHGDNAGDLNGSWFNDPEFNAAVKAAQSELEPARRADYYRKAYERYRDQLPTLPLVHVRQMIGLSKKLAYDLHPIEYRFYEASFRE